jgi:hypothetical protein
MTLGFPMYQEAAATRPHRLSDSRALITMMPALGTYPRELLPFFNSRIRTTSCHIEQHNGITRCELLVLDRYDDDNTGCQSAETEFGFDNIHHINHQFPCETLFEAVSEDGMVDPQQAAAIVRSDTNIHRSCGLDPHDIGHKMGSSELQHGTLDGAQGLPRRLS